ncbi:DUF4270 family protein [uncultured Bacteroides sp.]|uniref:DUF4270 family protein n=1 Tax=uncultured Bacteroides sp. TaxID=162156 RepID=UPI0025D01860|nr:DUF4270 family protein [uncultured Bacteroides sp.]
MKKLLYSLIAMLTAVCACQDENSKLGQSLVDSSFYNVYADTCTVDISTILMDSIETRGDTICQLGRYRDDSWGEVSAAYYAEYSTNSFTPDEDYSYSFDSLVLRMTHTGHFWGDTLTQQHISVYRLKQPIILEDDDDLYNNTVLPAESTPLFSFTFSPRPGRKKELEIRLPDELGKELLNDLINEEEYFDTQDKFKEKFPGLAFIAENSGECITGFMVNDSSMTITLHYQEITNLRTEKELTFTVNKDYAYTGLRTDRTGTPLATMTSGIENLIHSNNMNMRAYMQGLTGFYNQIEFPHLNNLLDAGDIVSIEKATLYLYPLSQSYNKINQLPEDIRLYITDENNVLEDYVYGSDGVTVQTGNLTVDDMFWRDTYYSFDVTEFIRNNFGTWGIRRQKLLLGLPDNEMATTFNQIIFTNDPSQERQCRLDIRFKIYNEQ